MQHNAYTHGGTIGIGGNVNANDFPNIHSSNYNNSHVLNATQTSLTQTNNNNNNNNNSSNDVATTSTSSRGVETGAVSPNDVTSIDDSSGVSAVNYGARFFGNEYHHQLTQSALMANSSTYAASSAASTAMLTNYCDAAMMMAAAAVNANQCLQQQQQRMALMVNCPNATIARSNGNDERDSINSNTNKSPVNNDSSAYQPQSMSTPLVSTALLSASSTASTTSSSSSLLSSAASSSITSPSITLVNTASLISTNADPTAGHLQPHHHNHSHHSQHHLQFHHHLHHDQDLEPVTSPNLIDISEVPLIVDVK